MSNDHFVAQTYLKHFADTTGRLHAYRKPSGQYFPCHPRDVCHEWDGDTNPDFLPHAPNLLGDYREMFEPRWNQSLDELRSRALTHGGRFLIAGYVANLLAITPAVVRLAQEHFKVHAIKRLEFAQRMRRKYGNAPPDLPPDDAIEAVKEGRVVIEFDPGFVKAKITRRLLLQALHIYHQDWAILENTTARPFITSDNPTAFETQRRGLLRPLARYIPLDPRHCLVVQFSADRIRGDIRDVPAAMQEAPRGGLTYVQPSSKRVAIINDAVIKCATEFVFANHPSDETGRQCVANGNYGVEFVFPTFEGETENREIHGALLVVRDRTDPRRPHITRHQRR